MGTLFELPNAVSTPATLTREQKAELSKLAILKGSSLKKEIYEAVNFYLFSEENQKILKGEREDAV